MKKKYESIIQARNLLRTQELGVLSTHSKAMPDFPFGSVSTYVSTVNGEPVFYISDLAQHTKNIHANPKMCLTVFEGNEEDPNAGARLSILGEAVEVDKAQSEFIRQRFFALYPDSIKYQNMHDFSFYILKCNRVRYIGGFGEIYWISSEDWLLNTPDWLESEPGMIEHMNQDHKDAMQLMCRNHYDIACKQIELLSINPEGFFVKADHYKPLFIAFQQTADTANEVRQQMVLLTKQARIHLASVL